jgi:bacterioferritin (cytochrome b1)
MRTIRISNSEAPLPLKAEEAVRGIVAWLRGRTNEAQAHAILAGEHITSLGGHPSLKIGGRSSKLANIDEILREARANEREGLAHLPRAQ